MKPLYVLSLALLLAPATAAALVQEPPPAIVEGTVTRSGTEEPVENILVVLAGRNSTPRSASTDAAGRFRIEGIAPGMYIVTVSGAGFVRAGGPSGPASLNLRASEHRRDVRIMVEPTAVISGRVLDDKRRPRSGITVQLMRKAYDERGNAALVRQEAIQDLPSFSTDDRGEYRLYGLPSGEYLVRAVMPSRITPAGPQTAAAVYYPGVTDPAAAVGITLKPGGEAGGIDFAMAGAPAGYPVRFKVSGFPPGTANLMIRPFRRSNPFSEEDGSISGGCVSTPPETRTCTLLPGRYDLFARTLSSLPAQSLFGRIEFEVVDREVEAPPLVMRTGVPIQGRLLIPETLHDRVKTSDLSIHFSAAFPLDNWFSSETDDFSGIKDDGSFRLEAFWVKHYIGISGLPDDVYIESARYSGRDVLDSGLTVEKDSGGLLELSLAGPAGAIEGVVRTAAGDPASNALVVLAPPGARRDNPDAFKETVTDEAGAFSIEGVAPGRYSVLSWENIERGAHLNRAFVERYEQRAAQVLVERGATVKVNVTLIIEN